MATIKPSRAQLRVLKNLVNGRDPWCHVRGGSQSGGSSGTDVALRKRGWIDATGKKIKITRAGRAICAEYGL